MRSLFLFPVWLLVSLGKELNLEQIQYGNFSLCNANIVETATAAAFSKPMDDDETEILKNLGSLTGSQTEFRAR